LVVRSSRLLSGAERQMTSGCSTRAPVIRSRSERIRSNIAISRREATYWILCFVVSVLL